MALDAILNIFTGVAVDPVKEYFLAPIKRHIGYAFTFKSKVKILKDQVGELTTEREDLQLDVDQAIGRGDEIKPGVKKWLTDAKLAIEQAENIITTEDQAREKYCYGFIPNLKKRYQLGKNAEKVASAITELQNGSRIDPISYRPPLQQKIEPSVYGHEGLNSRLLMLKQVMDAIMNPDISMIGVYGMAGVGKTTLAKEIHRQAIEDNSFDVVVMATVSQSPDIDEIQKKIADVMEVKLEEGSRDGKAWRLHQVLMKKNKILVILDDVWEEFSLKTVGIPSVTDHKSCKIFLTSRNRDVLTHTMGTERIFGLQVLREDEAQSLFQQEVGNIVSVELQSMANEIAKKCGGLPLSIVTVAKRLKNRKSYEWNVAMQKFSRGENEGQITAYEAIELSYSSLEEEEVKSFFLLCGLVRTSNIPIENLVSYSLALRLFNGIERVEDARNMACKSIRELKDFCLLQDGDRKGCVKMHDLVRDTAVLIASRTQQVLTSSDGVELKEWPKEDRLKSCTRIYLPYCNGQELPERLESPELEFLMLGTTDESLKKPDLFFEGIRKLKVLHLRNIHFQSLPRSLGSLTNLRALCFRNCMLDDMSIIGELKQLKVLSFQGFRTVRQLPREIGQLAQLQLLDLRGCGGLEVVPSNVLSGLSQLEELYMGSFNKWDEEVLSGERNASIAELECLSQLTALEINAKMFPKNLLCKNLKRYRIQIGDWEWGSWYGNNELSRILKLRLDRSIHLENWVKILLTKTEDLSLVIAEGIRSVFHDTVRESLPHLKHLCLYLNPLDEENCTEIEPLFDEKVNAFPTLEEMEIFGSYHTKKLWHNQVAPGSFDELKKLTIANCKALETVFPQGVWSNFKTLEVLSVANCDSLQEIYQVQEESIVEETNRVVDFELRELHREGLHSHQGVAFHHLRSVKVSKCKVLKDLIPASIACKGLLQLREINVKYCYMMEEIIKLEAAEEATSNLISFPSLISIDLLELPTLSSFYSGSYNLECPSLKRIKIHGCPKIDLSNNAPFFDHKELSNLELSLDVKATKMMMQLPSAFLSRVKFLDIHRFKGKSEMSLSALLRGFLNMETLHLSDSSLKNQLFRDEGLGDHVEDALPLPRPKNVLISRVDGLKHILKEHSQLYPILQYVETLQVSSCHDLISLAVPSASFQNLTTLDVQNCNGLINLLTSSVAISMVQLVTMTVSECLKLTEVVVDEQDGTTEEISFSKLKTLKLVYLPNLASFCIGNCIFQFPSLEQVIVENCPKMMIFSPGSLSTPNLKRVQLSKSSSESDLHWAGNLNDTIEQMYMEMVGFQRFFELNLSEFPRLKENWHRHSSLSFEFLSHLEELTVENCELFSCAISSNVVKFLNKLTDLIVKKCDSIEEVFDLEGQNAEDGKDGLMSQLEKLYLIDLPKLRHLWSIDAQRILCFQNLQTLHLIDLPRLRHLWSIDAQRILCFQNLKSLEIHNCGNLTNIFTLSMAMGLVSLRWMKIKGCALVEKIITKEEEQEEGWNKIIFPSLSHIDLEHLPSLQCFYSGSDILECPSLEDISAVDCPKMKILASTFSREQDSSMNVEENKERICEGDSDLPAPHVFNGKVAVRRLDTLRVAWSDLMEIWCHKFQSKSFHKLSSIELTCFPGESAILSSDFFQRLPNLRTLALSDSLIEEIFLHQVRTDEHRYLAFLELSKLPKLKHLAENDYSQTISAFQLLEELEVVECGRLKVLVPSSISFPNLTTVTISKCHGLVNLMPLSTARCLGQLQRMSVNECEMLQQIAASEGDGVEDEICFSKLKDLNLGRLPCLASFCSGNHAFNFPSLETMIVTGCPKMKFFAQGVLSTPKLRGVHSEDNWRWEGNLNDTIQELFMEMGDE